MSPDPIHAPWQQLKIQLRKTWSALTDEDLEAICQGHDDLVRVVQFRCDDRQDEAVPLKIYVEDCQIDQARTGLARLLRNKERRTPVILRMPRRAHRWRRKQGPSESIGMRASRTRTIVSPTATGSSP